MRAFLRTSFLTLGLLATNATANDGWTAFRVRSAIGGTELVDLQGAPSLKEQIVGTWVREMGKATDAFYSTMTLDLHADGTMTLDNLMVGEKTGKIEMKAEGRWALDGKTVTLALERSSSGREIPAEQKTVKFTAETDPSGTVTALATPDGGPPFKRQSAPAK